MTETVDLAGVTLNADGFLFNSIALGNGPRDGIMLVDKARLHFPHFISWEGNVSVILDMETYDSVDVGVTETDFNVCGGLSGNNCRTSAAESIQLQGTGSYYGDFAYVRDITRTPDAVNDAQTVNGYCTCAAGWTGSLCDVSVDDCASTPCYHGATCTDGHITFTCECKPGFTGTFCQSMGCGNGVSQNIANPGELFASSTLMIELN